MDKIKTRYQFSSYSMFEYKDIEDTLARISAKGWKIELCSEKGWTKEIQWKEMQVFSSEAGALPLEIKEATRVDNACLAMEKAFVPNLRLAFFLLIAYIGLDIFKVFDASITYNQQTVGTFLCSVCVTLICGVRLLNYGIWKKTSKQCISQGKSTNSTKRFRQILDVLQMGTLIILIGTLIQVTALSFGKEG